MAEKDSPIRGMQALVLATSRLHSVNRDRSIVRQQRGRFSRDPQAEALLRDAGIMTRTWSDWGCGTGYDDLRIRSLLRALRARAAQANVIQRGEIGSEAVSLFSDPIRDLEAQTGLSAARLADDLANDINLWARFQSIGRIALAGNVGARIKDRPRSLPVPVDRLVHVRNAANLPGGRANPAAQEATESAQTPTHCDNSNSTMSSLASRFRAGAGSPAGGPASGPLAQSATTAMTGQLAQPTRSGRGQRETVKPGPKPGSVARFREQDRARYAEIERLMTEGHLSSTAATERLAAQGMVAGSGTSKSRAARLRKAYMQDNELAPTRSN